MGLAGPWIHRRMLGDQRIGLVGDIGLELGFELVNLVSQVSDDVLISGYVLANHLFVRLDSHLDIFGPIRVLQSVNGLFVLASSRRASSDHNSFTVATKGVLEHPGELTIPKWHEEALFCLITEGVDAISES